MEKIERDEKAEEEEGDYLSSNSKESTLLENVEDVGQALIALFERYGLEHLFLTGGTDLAPIQDALVKFEVEDAEKKKKKNRKKLIPINVPHETVSTGMALGYAMLTGKPAAVAVHVHVGTANALGNIMNAKRSRVPLILLAGRTPYTESGQRASRDYWIHWGQDVYEPAGILREFVKWEYEITRKENLPQVVARALRVSRSDPPGPVYLTFGREMLMESVVETPLIPQSKLSNPVAAPSVDPEKVEDVAKLLFGAHNPLVICGSLGRNTRAVEELRSICTRYGVAVAENVRTYMNYPTDDDMHVGFGTSELVRDADVIAVLDCIVPWIPAHGSPPDSAMIIQVDQDPSFPEMPMWSFPIDLSIKADSYAFLRQLGKILERRLDSATARERSLIDERKERIKERHVSWKAQARKRALEHSKDKPIDMEWLSFVLNRKLMQEQQNFLLVNEYSMSQDQVEVVKSGTLFGQVASGYLGRGLGQALGLKLASPQSLVVCCVGDGSYIFGVPEAAHWVSRAYDLPFLTIIFNNQGWAAERDPIDRLYPSGWSARNSKYIGVHLDPPGDYSKIVEAFGGYGERVEDPDEIESSLDRAILQVKSGQKRRQAVLDVICKRA